MGDSLVLGGEGYELSRVTMMTKLTISQLLASRRRSFRYPPT